MRAVSALFAIVLPVAAQPIRELTLDAPAPPAVRTVSARYSGQVGGGTYYYWVIAHYPIGRAPASPPGEVRGVGQISVSSPVLVSWTPAEGATSYDVLRTDFPWLPAACNCAVATGLAPSYTQVPDTGGTLGPYVLDTARPALISLGVNNRDYAVPVPVLRAPYERLIASLRTGASVPASCHPGETFVKTDAPSGQKWYYCAGSTFEQSAGGGGGGPHAYQHKHGGGDEVADEIPGAFRIPKANADGVLSPGWIPPLNGSQIATGTISAQRLATEVIPGRCLQFTADGASIEPAASPCGANEIWHGDLLGRNDDNQHPASSISFLAYGWVNQTTVQSALQQIIDGVVRLSAINQPNGVAGLDASSLLSRSVMPIFVGDTGAGGQRGAVPPPSPGDATRCLRGDGSWGNCGVIAQGAVPNNGYQFTNVSSLTVPNTTHQIGHRNILVTCYLADGSMFLPASVAVNQSTFDVTVDFGVPTSGYCVLNGFSGGDVAWQAGLAVEQTPSAGYLPVPVPVPLSCGSPITVTGASVTAITKGSGPMTFQIYRCTEAGSCVSIFSANQSYSNTGNNRQTFTPNQNTAAALTDYFRVELVTVNGQDDFSVVVSGRCKGI